MREIRTRIRSIQDTMKITNAMYLMSSSKMKKAKKSLDVTIPYFELLQRTIENILIHSPHIEHRFFSNGEEEEPEKKKRGYIVVSADKGLAGAYNHNIMKLTQEQLKLSEENTLFIIGNVGKRFFLKGNSNVKIDEKFFFSPQYPTIYTAKDIAEIMISLYDSGELDEIYVIYTMLISSIKQEVKCSKLLPLHKRGFQKDVDDRYYRHTVYSPSPEAVLNQLVPNYIKGMLYGALVEAFACEQSARMVAMDNATQSAKDMIKDLSLQYNRARQAAITQEITEIVSGAKSTGR